MLGNLTIQTCLMLIRILLQDGYKRSTSGQVPATSENNNNLPITFGSNTSNELCFTENTGGTSCNKATRVVAIKADLEKLAQNRGNAMQRYKEKRKNRRYMLCFFTFFFLF